ncbi:MAG TPA: zf-HC2 domain-containing protein, partial [Streptosporangiaceae bacterium]|nr:zf-HC2 domain-containing protein [Streptosporangiaceae bacterium]
RRRGDRRRGGTGHAGTACGDARRALGVYVLGAIEPDDRGPLERHLARCASCREELARLADLPGWLSKVPPDEAERLLDDQAGERARSSHGGGAAPGGPPPPRPGHTAKRASPAGRGGHGGARWWRRAGLAAGAVVMGVGAVVASRALYPSPVRPAAAVQHWAATVRGQDPLTHVGLIVRYAPTPWGLALDVRVSGVPDGTRCELLVVNSRGQRVPAGSWLIAADDERAWYPASSSVRASAIRGFLVTSAGRPLVTARPETYRQ